MYYSGFLSWVITVRARSCFPAKYYLRLVCYFVCYFGPSIEKQVWIKCHEVNYCANSLVQKLITFAVNILATTCSSRTLSNVLMLEILVVDIHLHLHMKSKLQPTLCMRLFIISFDIRNTYWKIHFFFIGFVTSLNPYLVFIDFALLLQV